MANANDGLIKDFTQKKAGAQVVPLAAFAVNGRFQIAIYQGAKSAHDIIIKYRQKQQDNSWSKIRTPKHIHWVVDMLSKRHAQPDQIKQFVGFLIGLYDKIAPIKHEDDIRNINTDTLLQEHEDELELYEALAKSGEYSIRFLLVLAKLLMTQERTNYPDGKLFQKLLAQLEDGKDLFQIVSTATQR